MSHPNYFYTHKRVARISGRPDLALLNPWGWRVLINFKWNESGALSFLRAPRHTRSHTHTVRAHPSTPPLYASSLVNASGSRWMTFKIQATACRLIRFSLTWLIDFYSGVQIDAGGDPAIYGSSFYPDPSLVRTSIGHPFCVKYRV